MSGRGTDSCSVAIRTFSQGVLRKRPDPALAPAADRQTPSKRRRKSRARARAGGEARGLHIVGTEPTSHGASTISCADAPVARRPLLAFTFRSRHLLRIFGSERIQRIMERLGWRKASLSSTTGDAAIGTARSALRPVTSRFASTCSSMTTS